MTAKKKGVEAVLVKPRDTSDEALDEAADRLFEAIQALREKARADGDG